LRLFFFVIRRLRGAVPTGLGSMVWGLPRTYVPSAPLRAGSGLFYGAPPGLGWGGGSGLRGFAGGGDGGWGRVCRRGLFWRGLFCGFGAFALLVAAVVELLVGGLFLHKLIISYIGGGWLALCLPFDVRLLPNFGGGAGKQQVPFGCAQGRLSTSRDHPLCG